MSAHMTQAGLEAMKESLAKGPLEAEAAVVWLLNGIPSQVTPLGRIQTNHRFDPVIPAHWDKPRAVSFQAFYRLDNGMELMGETVTVSVDNRCTLYVTLMFTIDLGGA